MSTEENKLIARRFVEEMMSGHHVERIDEFVTADAVNHERGHIVNYREALCSVFGVRESRWEFVIEDIIAEGDRVMVRCAASYNALIDCYSEFDIPYKKGTRATVEHVHIFRLVDGMIVEHWPVRDDLHAVRQFHEPVRGALEAVSGSRCPILDAGRRDSGEMARLIEQPAAWRAAPDTTECIERTLIVGGDVCAA